MTVISNHRHLLGHADAVLRKADDAQRSGDVRAIAEARREGVRIRDELAEHAKNERTMGLLKAALATPRSSASPRLTTPVYSDEERAAMARTGEAMPNGSYPIKHAADVSFAVENWRNAGQPADARKHILRRATELGALDRVPDDWRGDTAAGGDNPAKLARATSLRKFGR
jgi:hypothetical protein